VDWDIWLIIVLDIWHLFMPAMRLYGRFFAFAFPLFEQAMYKNLSTPRFSVAWGSALLGFLAIGMATIPFFLYRYGPASIFVQDDNVYELIGLSTIFLQTKLFY
jgi:hypothetical protein